MSLEYQSHQYSNHLFIRHANVNKTNWWINLGLESAETIIRNNRVDGKSFEWCQKWCLVVRGVALPNSSNKYSIVNIRYVVSDHKN